MEVERGKSLLVSLKDEVSRRKDAVEKLEFEIETKVL